MELRTDFVNDGSVTNASGRFWQNYGSDPRVRVINFSRNFGMKAAMLAG